LEAEDQNPVPFELFTALCIIHIYNNPSMRIILFTGKGGVGKTTMAAATAYKTAEKGLKTLVISTDPAHSLSDAMDVSLGPEPVEVAPNLHAQELDVYYSMQKYWSNIRSLMLSVFRWHGLEHVLAEEMSALPGMEEASAFLWIEKYYTDNAYDVIIIDSAPTGETLTLLTLPQVTKWWVTKALPLQRFAIKNIGRVARVTAGIPIDKGYEELESIFDKLERIQKIFGDPEICSIRLVVNPERMVLNESKRAYTYLSLYGYNVDAVLVNRIFGDADSGTLGDYIKSQEKYLDDIQEVFLGMPILRVMHQGGEVFGTEALHKVSEELYGKLDPAEVLYRDEPYKFEKDGDGYLLRIKVPFIKDKQYALQKYGDEVVIQLGNRRKNLFLPRFVNFYELDRYHYEHPWLIIHLKP
jgi:arsenite-transporting ATPase